MNLFCFAEGVILVASGSHNVLLVKKILDQITR
jgi:hypothetical protein